MSNVHTLKNINKRGHRLGSAYEQELEKKIRSVTEFNSEINDLSEKLVDKYDGREKEFQRFHADIGNKISQLNGANTKLTSQITYERMSRIELEAKYSAEIKSLKSNIKILKKEATLAQKASSADKVKILSLEAKVVELEGKLLDLELERDSHIVGELLEKLIQIDLSDPKENDSLRLELKQTKDDLSSKDFSNIPPPPMNDLSQKLSGWVNNDLKLSSISLVLKIKL
jgi:hypothetical protein